MEFAPAPIHTFFCIYLRCAGALSILPFTGPARGIFSKLLLACALALFFAHQAPLRSGAAPAWFFEFLLGAALTLPAALAAQSAAIFGEFFDAGRGQTLGAQYDPFSGINEPQLAALARNFIWVQFLIAGGLTALLLALKESFSAFPLGDAFDGAGLRDIGERLLHLQLHFLRAGFSAFLPFGLLFIALNWLSALIVKILPHYAPLTEQVAVCSGAGFWLVICCIEDGALLNAVSYTAGLCWLWR